MKYFTPELLARCRSHDDDAADVAAKEWEEAIVAYRARAREIRPFLPRTASRFLSRFTLHDARLLGITFGDKRPDVSLIVRLEDTPSRPGEVLELSYLSVAGPHGGVVSRKHPESTKGAHDRTWVLYDEFDVDEQRNFFIHSLLLTGGFEIEVRFHNFRVRRLEEAPLSPVELVEGKRTWLLTRV